VTIKPALAFDNLNITSGIIIHANTFKLIKS